MTLVTRRDTQRDADRRREARVQIEQLAWLLDQAIPIPLIGKRIGLDGIVGLVPGLGDVVSGAMGFIVVLRAMQVGLPRVVIARMVANVALDLAIGAIPVIGDAFDLWYKANWRNARLFARYAERPEQSTRGQWVFFAVIVGALALAVVGAALLAGALLNAVADLFAA
jgi:hypothetical protein